MVAQGGLLLLKHLQIFAKEILASGVCFWNLLSVQFGEQIHRSYRSRMAASSSLQSVFRHGSGALLSLIVCC